MTMHRLPWFDRRFELGLPPEAFPYIVERVRGAPVRLEERISSLRPGILKERAARRSPGGVSNPRALSDKQPVEGCRGVGGPHRG